MKSFQKLFITCAVSSLIFMGTSLVSAQTVTDVPVGFWAQDQIIEAVNNNYLTLKGDKFYPNAPITRAEFANAVYELIQRDLAGSYDNNFSDIKGSNQYDESILTLNQLQIIFGYPDGTFKPDKEMKRSEASSVVANIIRSDFWDKSVLDKFEDKEDVPNWALLSYINNVINDVYVNYPDESKLLPNDYLTRAQTAVLIVKIKQAIEAYKLSYMPKEGSMDGEVDVAYEERYVPVFVGTNTLNEFQHAYKNTVNLYDNKKVIVAGNIVPVRSLQRVDSKTVAEGEVLTYVSPKDVYSTEGTKLYSQGTKFEGYVERVEKSYWFKRQDKSYIVFNKAILTDGTEFPIAGVLYATYKGDVVLEKEKNSRKIENDANKKYSKRDAAIYFANKKLVPVLKYNEKAEDNLFMLITGDMIIPESGAL